MGIKNIIGELQVNGNAVATTEYVYDAMENAALKLDTTLSQEGKAADAKAVGDALSNYITSDDATTQATAILLEAQSYTNNAIANINIPKVPTPTPADAGKFLMVDENGNIVLASLLIGEDLSV